jgi:peptidoglycan L-alanyl-D-glutamate endopeptidase CwlK
VGTFRRYCQGAQLIETRDMKELLPVVAAKAALAISSAEARTGLRIIVTCTFRDDEKQRWYYEQGRTRPGAKVTNDPGPGAAHSLRVALDIAPAAVINGRTVLAYETSKWAQIAQCFKEQGFEWGGDWLRFKDRPHFQYTKEFNLQEIRAGAIPG